MTKIPVGATIAHAYRFAFGNFLDILKVIWLPVAIAFAISHFIQGSNLLLQEAAAAQDLALMGQALLTLLPAFVLIVILYAMQTEGAMRLALGLMPNPGPYYFPLGRPVWRLLWAWILAGLFFVGAIIVCAIAGGLAGAVFGMAGASQGVAAGLFIALLTIAAFCLGIYGALRLTYFLTPSVIAEETASPRRSWKLARGNFWRILGVLLAVALPAFLLFVALLWLLFAPGLPPFGETDPELARQAADAWEAEMNARINGRWYIFYPISLLFTVVFVGLVSSAEAFAYRTVAQTDGPWSSASRP